mgnify:FL=1
MRKLELPCEIGDLVYEVFFDEELKRAVLVPPHKVEDVSVYSILIGGDWTSRSEIGKTVFFEPEEAVKACAEMNATKGVSIEIGDHIYEVFFDEELKRVTLEPPRKVEDISEYSILIDGRWVSRSEIGKTLFFELEGAVGACLKMSYGIGWLNIVTDIESGETHAKENDDASDFD